MNGSPVLLGKSDAWKLIFIHSLPPKDCLRQLGLSTDYQDTSTVLLVMAMQKKQSSNVYVTVVAFTEGFDVAVFTVYSVLMNVNNLFSLIHFHLFQNMYYVSTDSMHYS